MREGTTGAASMYAGWTEAYASKGFADLAEMMVEMLASLADELSAFQASAAEASFLASSRYEYLYWEMAWQLSSWPIWRIYSAPKVAPTGISFDEFDGDENAARPCPAMPRCASQRRPSPP